MKNLDSPRYGQRSEERRKTGSGSLGVPPRATQEDDDFEIWKTFQASPFKNKADGEISKHFRDDIELHAACKFLHDAGEIVRFEDAALRDLIFVDSVWLSDSLYSVMSLK